MKLKFLFIAIMGLLSLQSVQAQAGYDSLPPYQKDSTLPNFQLLRADSSWLSTAQVPKKTPVVITFFNPDCEHCQHEATLLAKDMKQFKNVEFIWATYAASFEEIDAFATKYQLKQFSNVHFVKDPNYAIPSFYHLEMTPYMAVYNKHKMLVKTFPMGVSPKELSKLLK
ncbi:MAG TPA: redoxin domain-containing protein [Arachidicoccus sp.]|nr:redoxin domain-containing protein [Arachidicoccus sp.]